VEALILAGGKAERLGEAARGNPKPLVPVAGHPLAGYTMRRLKAAGVTRAIVACARGQEERFATDLGGEGVEIVAMGEPEPLGRHAETAAAATVVVAQVNSPFGVVDLGEGDAIEGFREAPKLEHWVNAGVYVLGPEALERLPERGDHEQSTFPELAVEGKLFAYRHTGAWLTVNTPKDLRRAEEYLASHPDFQPRSA
jgi:NDP-sugar pyrophosphorylase family protein